LTRSLHGHGGRAHTRQAGEAAATTGNRPTPRRSPWSTWGLSVRRYLR